MNSDTVKEILILFWIIIPGAVLLGSLACMLSQRMKWHRIARRIERQQRVLDALDVADGKIRSINECIADMQEGDR